MDIFLKIQLSFFFTLLPLYLGENSDLEELQSNRSFENRDKGVNDLEMSFLKVKILNFFFDLALKYLNQIFFFLYFIL
jgi:hypothetical protein